MTVFVAPRVAFTRPNDVTAYAAGDLVANSTTAGSVVALQFSTAGLRGAASGRVTRAEIEKSNGTVTLATFVLHLFDRAKTLTNGDNGALQVNNLLGYIGSVDLDLATGAINIAGGPVHKHSALVDFTFDAPGQVLYGYLAAAAAYVPTALEVFTLGLHVET